MDRRRTSLVLLPVVDGLPPADSGRGPQIGAGLLRPVCPLPTGTATARPAVETARKGHPR